MKIGAETVWLSLADIAKLLGRHKSVISRHLTQIFATGELTRKAVVAKNATTAADGKTYQVEYFNLDVILSVGYRVNSMRGTQFRTWATKTLRDHLIRGFTLNERRFRQRGLAEMQETVDLLRHTLVSQKLVSDEGARILEVVDRYASTWDILLRYDEDRLPDKPTGKSRGIARLTVPSARAAVAQLKLSLMHARQASDLFGRERDEGLARIIPGLEQTFDRTALYPTAESRAAHLLYFVIKDHPFTDGNKRIGSFLFLDYLRRNNLLHTRTGHLLIDQRALVALALLVAESKPQQKELIIRLIMSLLAQV